MGDGAARSPERLKPAASSAEGLRVTTTVTGRAPARPASPRATSASSADRDAVEQLVRAHLPIVGYQVNETMARLPGHVHRDDLVSAGLAALAAAAVAFDAATGVPFARYATLRIRGALLDELRAMDWAPRGARTRAKEMDAAEDRLAVGLGRRPSRDELAAAMGCPPAEVEAVRRDTTRAVISLDAGDGAVADTLVLDQLSPEDQLLQGEQVHYLNAAVGALPERLRAVVQALFVDDRAVADVAAELGVTESRVSQLRTEALAMLKDGMNSVLEPARVAAAERPGGVVDRKRQAYFAAVAASAAARPSAMTSALSAPPAGAGRRAAPTVPAQAPPRGALG